MPIEATVSLSDGAQIILRRHGNPDGPRLLLSHGNGLAIGAYQPFWQLLADDFDLVLFDMRSHGVNPTHTLEAHTWARFTLDMGEILAATFAEFGEKSTVGVFHSLSAVASVAHALDGDSDYAGLVLFDPPLMPPPTHPAHVIAVADVDELAGRTLRRQTAYADPSELAEQFLTRPFFSRWVDGAAELFARHTLKQDADTSQWVLSCPREYEAQVFSSNRNPRLWEALCGDFAMPFTIVGADPKLPEQTAPGLICAALAEETDISYTVIPETTHFLQVEQPRACALAVERFVASLTR